MHEVIFQSDNGIIKALFFDVAMKSVNHGADAFMTDFLAELCGIGGRIDEVKLEAIEIFEHQCNARFFRYFACLLEECDASLPFVRGAGPPGKVTQWLSDRTAKEFGADLNRKVDPLLYVGHRICAFFFIRADWA